MHESKAICPTCGATVVKTHRMQDIVTQMVYHLRTHGLTIKQAKIEQRKAIYNP